MSRPTWAPIVILLLCTIAGPIAPAGSPSQEPAGIVAEIRAAGERVDDTALRRIVAARRLEVYEHFDDLLLGERPGDARVALRVARAYRETFGDEALARRIGLFSGWSAEQRAERDSALASKEAAKKMFEAGRSEEARTAFLEALARFEHLGDPKLQAHCLLNAGAARIVQGRLREGLESLDRAGELARQAGDLGLVSYIANNRAYALIDLGDLDAARCALLDALPVTRESGDRRAEAGLNMMLGSIGIARGELDEARDRYAGARTIGKDLGDAEILTVAWSNLASIHKAQNDFQSEEHARRQALSSARELGSASGVVSVMLGLVGMERRRGDRRAASRWLAAAEEAASGIESPGDLFAIQRYQAVFAAEDQDLGRALELLDRAEAAIEGAEVHIWLQEIHSLRAQFRFLRGDYEGAFESARSAAAAAEASENLDSQSAAHEMLAYLHQVVGELDAAAREVRVAVDLAERAGDRRSQGRALGLLALVQSRLGDHEAAIASCERALGILEMEGLPADHADFLLDLALLETRLGIRNAEKARGRVASAREIGVRIGDPKLVMASDLTATDLALRAGDLSAARAALDRARSTSLTTIDPPDRWRFHHLDGMVREREGRVEAAVGAYRRAVKEVERQRTGLRAVPRRAAMMEDRIQPYRALFRLQSRLGRLEEAYATARMAKARTFVERLEPLAPEEFADVLPPASEALVPGEIAPLAVLQKALRPGEVLLDMFVDSDAVSVFVLRRDRFSMKPIPLAGVNLAGLVEALRHPGTPGAENAGIARAFETAASRLGGLLLGSLEAEVREGDSLLIVPNAELTHVPFAALRLGGTSLVERHEVSVLPAAEILPAVRVRAGPAAGPALVVGDPAAGGGFDRLPGAAREARRVAAILGDSSILLLGERAREEAVRARAGEASVIHVAAHARVDSIFPAHSFVALAPGKGGDGRWTAEEIAGTRTRASLVTLSGCHTALQTGMSDPLAPGDEREGLVRAFLTAGAGSVVANLWEMDDAVAETVLPELYRRAGGRVRAHGLSALQREMILGKLRGPGGQSLVHPFYWAGLVSYGAGEGGRGAAYPR